MTAGGSSAVVAFAKGYPTAQAAETALQRSIAARAAGVPTPAVLCRTGPCLLSYVRVAVQGQPTLEQMMRVLARLHRMPPTGFSRFDPFLRIRPRLGLAAAPVATLAQALMAQDAGLAWAGVAAVHGDFHPGQVLRDGAGKIWLVDLDDIALAPPEADFGNLAAWLATQTQGELAGRAAAAQARVLAACPTANPVLLAHFCGIALLRRALKLAENGERWVLDQLPLRP